MEASQKAKAVELWYSIHVAFNGTIVSRHITSSKNDNILIE